MSRRITRDEAIQYHWDEIRENLTGTASVESCSIESGNCYDLEADISWGDIDTLHFDNGGYLSFGAGLDESGGASDIDDRGNSWDFSLDLNSPLVDNAIDEWAAENDMEIE